MAEIIAQFFGILIPNVMPPSNMQELIPYLLTVFVGIFLVGNVFKGIGAVASALFSFRRL